MPNIWTVVKDGVKSIVNVTGTCNSVQVSGGTVIVNGNVVSGLSDSKVIEVVVHGDVHGNVDSDCGNIKVNGNVDGDIDASCGNVEVRGSCGGDIDVSCGNVRTGR